MNNNENSVLYENMIKNIVEKIIEYQDHMIFVNVSFDKFFPNPVEVVNFVFSYSYNENRAIFKRESINRDLWFGLPIISFINNFLGDIVRELWSTNEGNSFVNFKVSDDISLGRLSYIIFNLRKVKDTSISNIRIGTTFDFMNVEFSNAAFTKSSGWLVNSLELPQELFSILMENPNFYDKCFSYVEGTLNTLKKEKLRIEESITKLTENLKEDVLLLLEV